VVRRILQADDVPAFSRVMQELMTSLGSDSSSAPQLASLVLRDYAITARVIRTANSAHYNRSGRPVQSATHAIMLLGARTVRELASGVLLFEQYGRRSPGLKELMLLSLLTASHARAAAEAVGGADPETAHLCGMFRNLGEVLVAAHLSDEYAAVLRRLARGPAGTRGPEAARAAAAVVELGCTFEDVGAAVARHWGMPDAVRQAMFAAGAAGEARVDALAAFGHALTGAVYRGDPGRSAAGTAALLDGQGARLGISRALCKRVADRAVADTRELFAAAGLRLDDLRLTRQVTEALAEPGAAPGAGGRAPAGDLAGMPPAGAPALAPPLDGAPAARSLADVRAHLAPELAAAVDDVEGYDLGRVLLLALEAALRGGPCDRACFHAADHTAAAFRPRTALGDCTDTLLSAPGLGFSAADGPSGPALLRGEEVLLGPGTRLSLGEQQLLRRWDAVTVILLPVAVDGVVIGALHADRRTRFAAPDAAAMSYLREVAHALGRAMALRRGGRTTPAAAACAQAPVDPPATPPAVTAAQLAAAQPKVDAVLCLLRGEAPEAVAAAAGVDVATLEAWRAEFLAGAAARLAR
jgi:HD-like signal output (HDOD) protein